MVPMSMTETSVLFILGGKAYLLLRRIAVADDKSESESDNRSERESENQIISEGKLICC